MLFIVYVRFFGKHHGDKNLISFCDGWDRYLIVILLINLVQQSNKILAPMKCVSLLFYTIN